MKKKVLFIYPAMIIGGSTTALLSLLNGLDPEKYEIDLQLFRNEGPLLELLPAHVNLLPAAEMYTGNTGRMIKFCKLFFSNYGIRYLWKAWHKGYTVAVQLEFQARKVNRKNLKEYDYAIGYMEGWSNWYLAFSTKAKKRYAWIHSTYKNLIHEPAADLPWMRLVDKIAFVTEACRESFHETQPEMAKKTITIENIIDSEIIRGRSRQIDEIDADYQTFVKSDTFKIVTVCRLTIPVKGLDRIVDAAVQMKAQGLSFLWYIIGDGEDEAALLELIRENGVTDCVVPIGRRFNPYPFIKAADIMCMPSRNEGKPLAVTESMILGTPPVVTEYLSAHDQIKNGEEGIVAENEDDTIAEAVGKCIRDPEMVNAMRTVLLSREYGNSAYISKLEEKLFS